MKNLFERLAKVITHRPMLVAGIVVALFIVCLYGMTTISMATGWETYMVKDSPEGSQYNKYITTFQSDPVVLFIDTDTPISPDMLRFMDGLEGIDPDPAECQECQRYSRLSSNRPTTGTFPRR